MKNFWKIYGWIYLILNVFLVFYYVFIDDISQLVIPFFDNPFGHLLCYFSWFIPAGGILFYAYNKRFLPFLFWKLYFLYFIWGIFHMLLEITDTLAIPFALPFHLIVIAPLFNYAFRLQKNK